MLAILLRLDATISNFVNWNSGESRDWQSFQEHYSTRAALDCAKQTISDSPPLDGTEMDMGPYRIALSGLTRLAEIRSRFSVWSDKTMAKYFKAGFFWLLAFLIAGFAVRTILYGKTAENQPARLATFIATEPVQSPAMDSAKDDYPASPANPVNLANTTAEAITPAETAPLDGLKISSQSWRRGGLGSNALVTFTLRNGNDYAVKDIEISCAFARRDGSHLTERRRIIHDTVNMRSRKTFARMHIGFVNINADQAKCSLVAASHA
jgi:hypothetical protein